MEHRMILSIKASDPSEQATSLLSSLKEVAEVTKVPRKGMAPGWQEYIIIIGDVGKAAGGLAGFAALAKTLLDWRREARQREKNENEAFRARLRRPGQPPLDLESVEEEDIENWMPDDEDPDADKLTQ